MDKSNHLKKVAAFLLFTVDEILYAENAMCMILLKIMMKDLKNAFTVTSYGW